MPNLEEIESFLDSIYHTHHTPATISAVSPRPLAGIYEIYRLMDRQLSFEFILHCLVQLLFSLSYHDKGTSSIKEKKENVSLVVGLCLVLAVTTL